MKYLLDEDPPPKAAQVARGLGMDAVSIHELDRRGMPDDAQLRFAAREGRVFVTRNRDDFQILTFEFFRAGEAHSGVLIVGRQLPGNEPERMAHALERWNESREENPETFGACVIDFL